MTFPECIINITVIYNTVINGGDLMSKAGQTTLERILSAAMQEFLEKGYQSASLRNIVKTAGVTTGAFMDTIRAKRNCLRRWWGSSMTTYGLFPQGAV